MLQRSNLIFEILQENDRYVNALTMIPTLSKMLSVQNREFREHVKVILRKNTARLSCQIHLHTSVPTCMVRIIFSHTDGMCDRNIVASVVAYLQNRPQSTEQQDVLVSFLWGIVLRLHDQAEHERQTIFRCIDMNLLSRENLDVAVPVVGMDEARYLRHCNWLGGVHLDGTNPQSETFAMIEHTTEALRLFSDYRHDQHKQFRTIPVGVLNTFQNLWTSCVLCQTRLMESNSFFNLLCFVRYHISILQLGSVQFEVFLMLTLRGLKGVKTVSDDDVSFRQLLNMLIDCIQSAIDNTGRDIVGCYDCGLFLQAVSQIIYHAKYHQFSQHLVGIWGGDDRICRPDAVQARDKRRGILHSCEGALCVSRSMWNFGSARAGNAQLTVACRSKRSGYWQACLGLQSAAFCANSVQQTASNPVHLRVF
jgi:hypothetical protein